MDPMNEPISSFKNLIDILMKGKFPGNEPEQVWQRDDKRFWKIVNSLGIKTAFDGINTNHS